jgi:hypothetical protein
VSFAAITFCVASQRVFIFVSVYFVIESVRKLLITPSYETGYRYLKDELLAGQKSLGTTTVLSCICRTSVREAVIANVAIRHCAMYCPHPHPHYYPHNAPLICNRKRMKPHKIPPNKQPPLYVASRVSL